MNMVGKSDRVAPGADQRTRLGAEKGWTYYGGKVKIIRIYPVQNRFIVTMIKNGMDMSYRQIRIDSCQKRANNGVKLHHQTTISTLPIHSRAEAVYSVQPTVKSRKGDESFEYHDVH